MKKLLYDIFDNMQDKIPGQEEADKKISDNIKNEILMYEKQFSGYDWQALCDLCFSVIYTAKREWFVTGFYYATGLMFKEDGVIDPGILKKLS